MKTHKRFLCFLLAMLTFTIHCPAVNAKSIDDNANDTSKDKTAAPYFYVESEETGVDSFPLKKTDVTVDIKGIIADTHVTQTYANEGAKPINASYIFPASTKVTIHGMQMRIGNQTVTATIKEKEEAKQEFETAKSEGKSASISRPKVCISHFP